MVKYVKKCDILSIIGKEKVIWKCFPGYSQIYFSNININKSSILN